MNVFELAAIINLDTQGYQGQLAGASKTTQSFGTKLGNSLKTAAKVGMAAITAVSAAVTAFAVSSVKTGMAFDKSMSQVAATMGMTVDQINELRDFAQEMGRTTVFSATQAADALNYMALAGYDANTSMAMLPNVLNLAAAGSMDLARASDMVTDTQTAFGITLERTSQMVDEMAKAASTGNTSVEQLGDAFLTVGGLAKNLNGGMIKLADGTIASVDGVQELEIALTAMANAGVKGSEAGTHMRNMLLKLASPTEEGAQTFERLGVSVFDAEGNMRSLKDIMGDLSGALSNLTQEEKMQAISEIFNTRDMASAEALLSAVGQDWDAIGESILNAQGAAQKMADTQLDNLAGDITLFKSALEGAQIAISDNLSPALREFVQIGTAGLQQMTEGFKKDGLAGALSAFGDTLSKLVDKIVETAPKLVDAAVKLIDAFVQGIGRNVSKITKSAVEIVMKLVDGIVKSFPKVVDVAIKLVTKFISGLAKKLPDIIKQALSMIKELISTLTKNTSAIVKAGADIVANLIKGILQALPEISELGIQIIGALIQGIFQAASGLYDAVVEIFTGVGNKVDVVSEQIEQNNERIRDWYNSIKELTPQLSDLGSMVNAQGDTMEDVDARISEAQNNITSTIQNALREQGQLYDEDLAKVRGYVDEYIAAQQEKLDFYTAQQLAQLKKVQLESNTIDLDTAAQHLTNIESAKDQELEMIEQMYTDKLAMAETASQGDQEMYNTMVAQAQEWYQRTKTEALDLYGQSLTELSDKSRQWRMDNEGDWKAVGDFISTFKVNSGNDFQDMMMKANDWVGNFDGAKAQYLSMLEGLVDEDSNWRMLLMANAVSNGQELTAQQKQTATDMLNAYSDLPPGMSEAGRESLLGLINGIEEYIPELSDTSEMSADEIVDTLREKLGIQSPSKVLKEIGSYAIEGLIEGMKSQEASLKTLLTWTVIYLYQSGQNMADGMANGFLAREGAVTAKMVGMVQRVAQSVNKAMEIKSPSRVFKRIGSYMAQGLEVGIEDEEENVLRTMRDFNNNIIDAFGNANSSMVTSLSSNMPNEAENISNNDERLFGIIYNALRTVVAEGFDLRWNDRELTRLVKEHA